MAICEMAEVEIRDAEGKYYSLIKKGWGKKSKILDSFSLEKRAHAINDFNSSKTSRITGHYKDILKNVKCLMDDATLQAYKKNDDADIDDFRSMLGKFLGENSFARTQLDNILPILFALQYHCFMLNCHINGPCSNASQKTAKERAAKGGAAKNHGRELLLEHFCEYLRTLPSYNNWTSIDDIFDANLDEFDKIIENYNVIKQSSQNDIKYSPPSLQNIPEKMKDWCKTHGNIQSEIERLIGKKKASTT